MHPACTGTSDRTDPVYSRRVQKQADERTVVIGAGPTGLTTANQGSSGRRVATIKRHLPFAAIFLLTAFLLTLNVNTPFHGRSGQNSVLFVGFATNHVRQGLDFTRGQDFMAETWAGVYPLPDQVPELFDTLLRGEIVVKPYGDHPPLLGLTEAAALSVFGESYAAMRVAPILYTLAGLVLFYLLVLRLFDAGVARLAALLYATFPILAYYGQMVGHESPTLFWGLALLTAYVHWRDDGARHRRWWATLMVASIVIGGCYGWPMYYCAGLLFAFDWLSRRRFDARLALLTMVPAVVTGVAVLAHIAWAFGGLDHLRAAAELRSGSYEGVGLLGWLRVVGRVFGVSNFGAGAMLLLVPSMVFLAVRIIKERFSQRTMIVTVLGAWGATHVLLFRQGAYIHDYWEYYLVPFIALTVAWAIVELARKVLPWPWLRSAGFVAAFAAVWLLNSPQIYSNYGTTLRWEPTAVESPVLPSQVTAKLFVKPAR